jgi:hypothetical protein
MGIKVIKRKGYNSEQKDENNQVTKYVLEYKPTGQKM